MIDTQNEVYATLRRVAADENLALGAFDDSTTLVDELGFKSLHIARILAILEMAFSYDPFASGEHSITNVRTVGDLCAAYQR